MTKGPAKRRRASTRPGAVYCILLADGSYGYCVVVKKPFVVFPNCRSDVPLAAESVLRHQPLFRLFIMSSSYRSERWKLIGSIELPAEWKKYPKFYRRDAIHHEQYSIYDRETELETPAQIEDCKGLEVWAVWSAVHVEPRLLDQLSGGSPAKYKVMV